MSGDGPERALLRSERLGWTVAALALLAALAVAWAPLASPHTLSGAGVLQDRVRAEAIHAAVEGGDLLPAWLPDLYLRHGAPLPLFYAPLGYFLVEMLRQATGEVELAWKLAWLVLWVAAASGGAAFARNAFGAAAALPGAAAYVLAPYFLVDAYVRAGIAELAGLALLPWAFAGLVGRGRRWQIVGVLAVAALPLTHNLTALIALPALLLLALLGPPEQRRQGLAQIVAGLALSLFFWLPALVEKDHLWAEESLTTGFFEFERHLLRAERLLPGREAVAFTVGPHERRPMRFGELLWLGLLASPWLARRLEPAQRRRALLLAAGALGSLFFTTNWSGALWRSLPLLRFVQFPFRFFLLATALAAPLVGLAVARAPARLRPWGAALIAALALLLARPLLEPRYLFVERATGELRPVAADGLADAAAGRELLAVAEFVTLERLRVSPWTGSAGHDFLPRAVERLPTAPAPAAAESLAPGVEVVAARWTYPGVEAEVRVASAGELALSQFHFPGWRVEVDGDPRPVAAEPARGRLLVRLEPGDRRVVARFGTTPLRRAAGAGSLLAALTLAVLPLARQRWRGGAGGPVLASSGRE